MVSCSQDCSILTEFVRTHQLKTEEKSATLRAAEAKTAADTAWVEALAAQVALCTRP